MGWYIPIGGRDLGNYGVCMLSAEYDVTGMFTSQ